MRSKNSIRIANHIVWEHVHKEHTADCRWVVNCNCYNKQVHHGKTKPTATKCTLHVIQCSHAPKEMQLAVLESNTSEEVEQVAE